MVLTRIFKPKWQHRDPEVRRQAIEALTSDDADILARVAREDEVPAVRLAALDRLDDLDLMHCAAQEDSDQDIRRFARTRLSELLAGIRKRTPALDVRLEYLYRCADTELLEFVAFNGIEAELRKSAQDRISRETLLRDIAIRDAVLANRQAALERINETATLEAVIRQTHKRDKHIYRQSRLRLDAIREAQQRPARLQAECDEICAALEAIGQGDNWQQELEALQGLDYRWQAIRNEVEPACRLRYELARDAFNRASAAFHEAREAEQRQRAVILDSRQALLTQLAQGKTQLLDLQALSADAAAEYAAELASWQVAWDAAGDLPAAEMQPLAAQYRQDIHSIRQRLETLQRHRQMEKDLQSLLDEAGRLMDTERPVVEHDVKSLERHCKAQHWPADSGRFSDGLQRFEDLINQLRKRLSHQREQRRTTLRRLPDMLDQLEAMLNKQTIKQAGPLHDRIQSSINHLQALGVSGEQLLPYTRRLHAMTPRVQELQSWRSWGADEARHRLCTEMEALIGSEINVQDLATGIRRLRTEWNRLRSDGGAGYSALRKRFDKAASEAYKPCAVFFKQQQAARNSNLEAKHALLQRLQAYLATAEWSDMDWKAAVKFQRQITGDWRQAGPVERRKAKAVEAEYRQAIAVLNEHIATERRHNLTRRMALIEQVRELHSVEDIHQAIEECKRLQGRWQTTVAGKRKQENALWQEFRTACDDVFLRRKQQQAAHHELEKQNKANRQQLCEQLEGLTASTLAGLDDAARQFHRIIGEWRASGRIAKRDSTVLEKRFEKAQQAFQAHAGVLREQEVQEQLEQLRNKAGYCTEVEQLLEHPDPAAACSRLETMEQQWAGLLPLQDTAAEQAMQARFGKARSALREGGEQREQLLSELRTNLVHRKELCLRMEILAGVDSPPEAQQARLELQVNRLAEAFGQGAGDSLDQEIDIQRAWCRTGGAPATAEQGLQARFENARKAAYSDRRMAP